MTDGPKSDIPKGTPEGYTEERPAATELGEPGTPGAGMTSDVPHAADADLVEDGHAAADPISTSTHHDATTHMDAHATLSDDDHGHAESTVGPIDWGAWMWALGGALLGVVVLVFFYLAVA